MTKEKFVDLLNADTAEIFKVFEQAGYKIRIVGGSVRDRILGIKSDDIDFATNALPEDIQRILKKNNIYSFDSGLKHGTITAVFDKICYEITTLRCDKECDGRHAIVEFTDKWELDASRRDFTFNALYLDKNLEVYDYFDGVNDLQRGVLNYIGDPRKRIQEDYLRILRAFRFQNKYCTQLLNEKICSAIKEYSHNIINLSGERIQTEIIKLLQNFRGEKTTALLNEFNNLELSKYVFLKEKVSFRILNKVSEIDNPWLLLAILARYNDFNLLDLKKRWQISNKNYQFVKSIVEIKIEEDFLHKKNKYLYKYFDIRDALLTCYKIENQSENELEFQKLYNEIMIANKPDFPLNAQILIAHGYQNKAISDNLTRALDLWLESDCSLSGAELLKLLKN